MAGSKRLFQQAYGWFKEAVSAGLVSQRGCLVSDMAGSKRLFQQAYSWFKEAVSAGLVSGMAGSKRLVQKAKSEAASIQ